jgi:CRISPR-associated protein Cmr3
VYPARRAVSGWSYKTGGPKAIRRMVPAGGVYFFKSDSNDNRSLADHWLRPVSDDVKDRRDGFGLALWGTWRPNSED